MATVKKARKAAILRAVLVCGQKTERMKERRKQIAISQISGMSHACQSMSVGSGLHLRGGACQGAS